MRPRREVFALDYIGETLSAYSEAVNSNRVNSMELKWAYDVLEEYFSVCGDSPVLLSEKEYFRSLAKTKLQDVDKQVPYLRNLKKSPAVSYKDLLDLAIRRRSVRWFLDKAVPRELVDQAIELAGWAPSACNRQPFKFIIFDDEKMIQKIAKIPFGMVGYRENVKMLAVLVGEQRNYFDERDRHLIYIDAALAAMGFLLGLETLGLSSCCVNWPEIARKDEMMAEAIGLSADERPVMLIAIGYPDPEGMVPRSTKKTIDNLRHYF